MKLFDLLFKRKKKETPKKANETNVTLEKGDTSPEASENKKADKHTVSKQQLKASSQKQCNDGNKSGQKPKSVNLQNANLENSESNGSQSAQQEIPPKNKATQKTSIKAKQSINTNSTKKAESTGRFELKKSKDGRFVFNLYASNGNIIATSQVYSSSSSAVNGIKSVIANAERAQIEDQTVKNTVPIPYPKWEIYLDKSGEYRFRLSASNGSCICHSQGYTAKSSCKNGIDSIRRFAKNSEIEKTYIDK